jgi:PAS domain S-box-containing protein
MLQHLSKVQIAVAWSVIFAAGIAGGWIGKERERSRVLTELSDDTKRCAVAFEGAELRRLTGSRADTENPVYAATKRRLIELQAVNPRVRFVYIFRSLPETGKVIFLADSAVAGAKDESLPGDDYPEAAESPGLQEILQTGLATTEGPLEDNFGTWITGYAPIDAVPVGTAGQTSRQLVGLDIDAADWNRGLWSAGFQWAFYIWMLLGMPLGTYLVVRRQLEQREAIRNLSEAMEQSHSALMVVDLESCIEYANRGLCQQIGYSRRELIGRNWREFQVADTSADTLAELVSTVRSGRPWEGEWFNRRKDGTVYPVRGVVTPVKRRDGTLSCFVGVFDDMTEIKRKEAELREARDLARAGDQAKGQFLATMSHEVRTPLNGIVGFTNLLLDTELSGEQRDFVQTIRSSSESLIQLTGDILDYARIESGKLALEPAPCDPRECVEDALDLLAGPAGAKQLEMLHWVDDGVPASIIVDGGRLRQVLVNLVNNAVKFTERGTVEVTVSVATEDRRAVREVGQAPAERGSVALVFSVRDTGIGIAGDQFEKLFRPFSQLDGTSTRKFGGAGLGLAICRNLVNLMGGEISFTSEPGRGSVFSFVVKGAVVEATKPPTDLTGLRLAIVARPGGLRSQWVRLAARWGAVVVEAETAAHVAPETWDLALVDIDEKLCGELMVPGAALPGLAPERTFGVVPLSLSTERRNGLRAHFRLLVNKPVHHEPLRVLLGGVTSVSAPPMRPPTHFKLRVLLVEDNPVNQRLMQKVLTNLGCEWTVAANGRLAVDELTRAKGDYDVVLMDLHMPELDGLAAIAEIREGKAGLRAKTVWIAALTADARDDQRARAAAAGANDYLTKPLKLAELEAALRRYRAERREGK